MGEFQKKINAFQIDGDKTIINEILEAVEMDFISNTSRTRTTDGSDSGKVMIQLEKNEHYIAYRIRAMRELIMRQYEGRITDTYIEEFQRLLSIIYIDLGIKFEATSYDQTRWVIYFNLTTDMFNEIERHMPEIEDRMHYDDLLIFKSLFYRYKDIITKREKEKDEAISTIDKSIIEALEHGLKYVDTTKTEREIVKYVNKAFSSKFSDLELERNGLIRIQRNNRYGERKILHVNKYFPDDLTRVVLGDYKEGFRDKLTGNQNNFINEILKIVEVDAKKGELKNYTCTRLGEARINKKYIAEKLGLSPATVRKRISRILNKLT